MMLLGVLTGALGSGIAAPPTQTFAPETYGAIGNGVADDTTAFQDMHTAVMAAQTAEPQLRVTIQFALNAAYLYTWNEWTFGIRYLTLEGNGASIRNTHTGPWHNDVVTWRTNHGALNTNVDDWIGHLIDTVQAGATAVTLKNSALATEFGVGEWVLVASYSQQLGGWPPNARYFDYAKIIDIDGGTITIDRPLEREHRDNWPSRGAVSPKEIDAARIFPLEKDRPWAEQWVIRNLTALTNTNYPDGVTVYVEGFNKIEFDNVYMNEWTGGQGAELIFRNCTLPESEPDKLLKLLRFEDCNTVSFKQCSGVDRLDVVNCDCLGLQFFGRELYVSGSTIDNSDQVGGWWESVALGGFTPVENAEFTNSSFIGPNTNGYSAFVGNIVIEKVIGSTGFSLSGTDLLVDATDPNYWVGDGLSNRIYEGQRLLLKTSAGVTRGYGDVVSIESNGADLTARIGMSWSVTPVNGDKIQQFAVMNCVGTNITMTDVDIAGPNVSIAYLEWNTVVIQDLFVGS